VQHALKDKIMAAKEGMWYIQLWRKKEDNIMLMAASRDTNMVTFSASQSSIDTII
jgi:hypothetical protein